MNIYNKIYRPTKLHQIKSQNENIEILNNLIINENHCNFLFYGLPGCGKTSCALAFAKKYYNTENYKDMILELNASEERGINIVRNVIDTFIKTSFFSTKKRMVILDEADSMTIQAQQLLIKLMENHNVIFIIICNYINKISIAIKSRCLYFKFNKIKFEDMYDIFKNIESEENIKIKESIYKDIYKIGNGDMRKCLNIFQNIHSLKIDNIYKLYNYPSKNITKNIINILLNEESIKNNFTDISKIIKTNNLMLKKIINEIIIFINHNNIFDKKKYLFVLEHIGNIEYNLSYDYNFKIQLCAMISIFKKNI